MDIEFAILSTEEREIFNKLFNGNACELEIIGKEFKCENLKIYACLEIGFINSLSASVK